MSVCYWHVKSIYNYEPPAGNHTVFSFSNRGLEPIATFQSPWCPRRSPWTRYTSIGDTQGEYLCNKRCPNKCKKRPCPPSHTLGVSTRGSDLDNRILCWFANWTKHGQNSVDYMQDSVWFRNKGTLAEEAGLLPSSLDSSTAGREINQWEQTGFPPWWS